ncbi:ATP-binding protein [Adonisia turfae]|nr:ATP-binding protein [Adonisia turfae]
MSCLAVGGVLTVGSSALLRERISFRKDLEQQAELLLDTLSAANSDALYFNKFDEAGEIINNLDKNSQSKRLIISARLYQKDGRVISDTFTEDYKVLSLQPDPLGQKILASQQLVLDWQDEKLIAGKPILVGEDVVGAVSIGFSTKPLQTELRQTLLEGLMAAVIIAIISILLARLLSRSITKPIQQLTTATKQISTGEWGQTINLQTNDELTTLSNAFNHMSGQLHNVVESLKLQTNELENSRQMAQTRANELEQTLGELRKTQEKLIQQEKMSSLGQMVAGVAHEINNPVTFIQGNVEPAQEYVADLLNLIELYQKHYPNPHAEILAEEDAIDLPFLKEDISKLLFSMSMGSERITAIVNSLKTFSRLDEALCKAVDLHVCLDSTLVILDHRLKGQGHRPTVEVIKDYGTLSAIECFAGQLNQVFMNLIANAIDAFEEPDPALELNSEKTSQRQIYICTSMTDNDHVLIQIRDNAGGMSVEVQSRIFDPFYTTKPVGKGTGLGLAISYQIITELHGGQLTCESIPGQGTEFLIEIPSSQPLAT